MKKMVILQAPAKINIGLWVKERRPDGFHELESLMQNISLADTVTIRQVREPGIQISCDHPEVPPGEDNLAYRAALLVMDHFAIEGGVQIHIEKRIPVAAGLAGGSSDAAAVLEGVCRVFDKGTPVSDLMNLAAKLGSDIPFMLKGGTAHASGRGEILNSLDSPRPPLIVLLAMSKTARVSTKWAYQQYVPGDNPRKAADFREIYPAYRHGDMNALRRCCFNDLESVVFDQFPELAETKARMCTEVPEGMVLMSGSGPSLFGLYTDKRAASRAASVVDPASFDVFFEHTLRHSGR
jgi:4-diphosphocytidyl-2-C-methyl-D-erythritol kinase